MGGKLQPVSLVFFVGTWGDEAEVEDEDRGGGVVVVVVVVTVTLMR